MTIAQSSLHDVVNDYLRNYQISGYQPRDRMGLDSLRADESAHELYVYANEPFLFATLYTSKCSNYL